MRKEVRLNFLLLFSSIVVSILFIEVSLQLIGHPVPIVSGWLGSNVTSISNLEMNQLGFRGRKYNYTDNDYVILLVGDSQVAAKACSFDWLPESRLEYHLNHQVNQTKNIRVFSLGTEGYGQDQQLLMLQKYYQKHRADLVILWQTPGNDVWNNIFPTNWPKNGWPKPTFRLVKGKLQGPSEQFGEELSWSKIKLFVSANRLFHFNDRDGDWEKHLPPPYKPLSDYAGDACYDWQESWDNNLKFRSENLATEKSHLAMSLTPISPRMEYGLDLTKALLAEIKSLVNSNKGDFVIFNVRVPEGEQKICSKEEVVYSLNGKYYKTSRKQFRDNIEYINADFVSFTVPVTIDKWRAGPEDSHLNEHATDQVLNDLATQIVNATPRRNIDSSSFLFMPQQTTAR
jgi:hypothetical protein